MNAGSQQLQGTIRTLLAYLAGLAAGKSEALRAFADPAVVEAVTTLVVGLIGFWSIRSNSAPKPPAPPAPPAPPVIP